MWPVEQGCRLEPLETVPLFHYGGTEMEQPTGSEAPSDGRSEAVVFLFHRSIWHIYIFRFENTNSIRIYAWNNGTIAERPYVTGVLAVPSVFHYDGTVEQGWSNAKTCAPGRDVL
jgi:hypothetical protein